VSAKLDQSFPSTTTAAASPAILCVDDNVAIRDMYGKILLQAGYDVDLADDGQAAWEALQRKKYELLITDYDMPRLTGLELAGRVREAGMTLPIIMASGFAWMANEDAHARLWLSSSLQKPFTPEMFLQAVNAVLCAAPLAVH
jgi:DNA-binding response OmpR family regulator